MLAAELPATVYENAPVNRKVSSPNNDSIDILDKIETATVRGLRHVKHLDNIGFCL
jgi:hypothetical protein